jgi:hypothetical protein
MAGGDEHEATMICKSFFSGYSRIASWQTDTAFAGAQSTPTIHSPVTAQWLQRSLLPAR